MFNLAEQSERICTIMQSGSSEIKLKIINTLLNELHGYYSQCHQKYTENSGDKAEYERTYQEAAQYLACLENNCVEWLATPEAASVKTKYDNYIGYAKLYLFTTCKPPHPSASIQRVEGLVTNSSSQI